ncbi:MAG: hypothetical protein H5U36_10255, partial [Candidatus Caldatribacterium sp.]|nr:hypothetical protein [Candidatus Caldatribacterium sp.]
MKWSWVFGILALSVFLFSGFLLAQEEEFTILSVSPSPDSLVPPVVTEIRIVFSQDAVPEEEVGVSKDFSLLPLSITPPISGQFLWEDK